MNMIAKHVTVWMILLVLLFDNNAYADAWYTLIGVNNSMQNEHYEAKLVSVEDKLYLTLTSTINNRVEYSDVSRIDEIIRITQAPKGNCQIVFGRNLANEEYGCIFDLEKKTFMWFRVSYGIPTVVPGCNRNLDFLIRDDFCELVYTIQNGDGFSLVYARYGLESGQPDVYTEIELLNYDGRGMISICGLYGDYLIAYAGNVGCAINVDGLAWKKSDEVFSDSIKKCTNRYVPDWIYTGEKYTAIVFRKRIEYGFLEKWNDEFKSTYKSKYVSNVWVLDQKGETCCKMELNTEYGNYVAQIEFYEDSFLIYTIEETAFNYVYRDIIFPEESILDITRTSYMIEVDYKGREIDRTYMQSKVFNSRLSSPDY